ncbi:MAG: extracellular solute-binding protein [Pseudomonadota bacterium]
MGKPQYGPDFKHFKWVNPNAPKGGRVRLWQQGSFDSLNPFSRQGDSAIAGGLPFDTLMANSPDEPNAEYGLIAEWVSHPDDFSSVTFGLRPQARWHDGKPITPEDVVFSLSALKKAHPQYAFYYKNVVSAAKTGERQVTFKFDVKNNRELPQIVGQLPILPKHWWSAKNAKGEARNPASAMLEPLLGSGPYKVAEYDAGNFITYKRVKDYWAKDLPIVKGQWNFDEIRYTYYRNLDAALESFKLDQIDYWRASSAKNWATAFNIPAVSKGLIRKERIKLKRPVSMQAFVLNTRRLAFQDARVRQAFNLAFDFETANKNLFYEQYERTGSYFAGTELASSGLPKGRELELLTPLKDKIPAEVFTTPFENPVVKAPGDVRKNLRQAFKLLTAAGWSVKNAPGGSGRVLHNKDGKPLKVEFLLVSESFKRIVLPYAQTLNRLGIQTSVRIVDSAQYQRRYDRFDFDIVVGQFPQSFSPGNEQRDYWSSTAADRNGSRNLIGIKNPAVDALIDKIIFAPDRAELVAATRALDRVLLWNHYVVPQWHVPYARVAFWNRFGRPKTLPSQSVSFLQVWWYDKAAASALADAK